MKLSVIVTIYNREAVLRRCVGQYSGAEYDGL